MNVSRISYKLFEDMIASRIAGRSFCALKPLVKDTPKKRKMPWLAEVMELEPKNGAFTGKKPKKGKKIAYVFPNKDEYDKYMDEHPGADKSINSIAPQKQETRVEAPKSEQGKKSEEPAGSLSKMDKPDGQSESTVEDFSFLKKRPSLLGKGSSSLQCPLDNTSDNESMNKYFLSRLEKWDDVGKIGETAKSVAKDAIHDMFFKVTDSYGNTSYAKGSQGMAFYGPNREPIGFISYIFEDNSQKYNEWNRNKNHDPKLQPPEKKYVHIGNLGTKPGTYGTGTIAIAKLIKDKVKSSPDTGVTLESLDGAESYYQHIGMKTNDRDDKDDYKVFTFTHRQAVEFSDRVLSECEKWDNRTSGGQKPAVQTKSLGNVPDSKPAVPSPAKQPENRQEKVDKVVNMVMEKMQG